MEGAYFVYILYSCSINKCYIGYTNDIERRIKEHNRSKYHYTKKGVPWIIAGYIPKISRKEAITLEKRLKKGKNISYSIWFIKNNGVWLLDW
jgi:putative endonuclease